MELKTIRFDLPLITHIAKTNNKVAPDKMFKINNQALYSQSLNRFARAVVVDNLHNYVIPFLSNETTIKKVHHIMYLLKTVRNHGDVRLYKGKLSWKKPKEDYIPTWDVNNLLDIWIKTGNDSLVLAGVVIDDNVSVINLTSYKVEFVDDIGDISLSIILKYYE